MGFTRKNPDGKTYRIPFNEVGNFKIQNDRFNGAFYGDFVDKLGIIEELDLDIELVKKLAKVPQKKLQEFLKNV